jgi:hypothetical protein
MKTKIHLGIFVGALSLVFLTFGGARALAASDTNFTGTYTRAFNGAGGKVTETLEIKADKSVTWTSNYPGHPAVVQTGVWNSRAVTLIVLLDKRDGEKMPAQERLVFDLKGSNLKGRVFDKNIHGNSAMIFKRS